MSWRKRHHWLRGYSDARRGAPLNVLPHHDDASYRAGYRRGALAWEQAQFAAAAQR